MTGSSDQVGSTGCCGSSAPRIRCRAARGTRTRSPIRVDGIFSAPDRVVRARSAYAEGGRGHLDRQREAVRGQVWPVAPTRRACASKTSEGLGQTAWVTGPVGGIGHGGQSLGVRWSSSGVGDDVPGRGAGEKLPELLGPVGPRLKVDNSYLNWTGRYRGHHPVGLL